MSFVHQSEDKDSLLSTIIELLNSFPHSSYEENIMLLSIISRILNQDLSISKPQHLLYVRQTILYNLQKVIKSCDQMYSENVNERHQGPAFSYIVHCLIHQMNSEKSIEMLDIDQLQYFIPMEDRMTKQLTDF